MKRKSPQWLIYEHMENVILLYDVSEFSKFPGGKNA